MKIVVFALFLSAHYELTTALKRKHFYITNAMTWIDAQSYCRDDYVDLSSADNLEDITALTTASGTTGLFISNWIGLKEISANNWEWSDGSQGSFINWAGGEPNENSNNSCVLICGGLLFDYSCSCQTFFFCYKWDTELIVVKENKSWEDALQYCRTHHTDLASLPTDLHLIQAKQTTADTSGVWTGLRFLAGSWFWLSDEDQGYVSVQLPACPANYTYCGSLNLKTKRWENRNCMEELNFVCY
nr:lymphocyte antigen 75-like [Misgurnus anguillicaudatus]